MNEAYELIAMGLGLVAVGLGIWGETRMRRREKELRRILTEARMLAGIQVLYQEMRGRLENSVRERVN
ncbi:MAG: hypothetical protein UX80_C0023G0004 [Candidatus Amesbacteria bacterium GW2011_GWA2_47_11b]|uniref:Uncharacterized protein n=3 Tax=Candidatus Amesiibacteriota TaxID=1752730 RepID=A0A0G1SBF5_9BACT|nr:MAG: hypothetical protein UX80_C0023G0004 [Candidatus Amesbacteria bacterium GW2011_GWA2_47_11b]KKU66717.1 MAG: hypothetical protein UX92_C0035G0003 [Candidatus Amesbacteria bacterium GW2011_GWA1_47_20]KKU83228.1 MAG: hypothetical protein UY11_C0025G0003 [Candidatus Amesbacteria bacterium GW2011_GWC2_47_8]